MKMYACAHLACAYDFDAWKPSWKEAALSKDALEACHATATYGKPV
jgi:hypothetical protein